MNAAIDIGNTRIKVGIYEDGKPQTVRTIEDDEILPFLETSNVKNLIVCSVRELRTLGDQLQEKYPHMIFFNRNTPIPLKINYKTPETLGLDRIAAAVGALRHFNGPLLIIDAGSCITCDLVDEQNVFSGGTISPGVRMRLKAMNTFTAKLPLVHLEMPGEITGKSTEEAMLSGVVFGSRYELKGFVEYYLSKYKQLKVILCGGDANYFDKIIEFNTFVLPNLVLEGLDSILMFNGVD
jgi:type III pantothenate kinase